MGDHPNLAELVAQHALRPTYDFGDSFEAGLGVMLDRIARLARDT